MYRVFWRHRARQCGVVGVLASCTTQTQPEAPPSAHVPAARAVEPDPTPQPAAHAETSPDDPVTCRALLNLSQSRVVDLKVRASGDVSIERGVGTVLHDGARAFVLHPQHRVDGAFEWGVLHGRYVDEVVSTRWIDMSEWVPRREDYDGDGDGDGDGDDDDDSVDFDALEGHFTISIDAVFGAYVSVTTVAEGYLGGAHGVDEMTISLRTMPEGKTPAPAAMLPPSSKAVIAAAFAEFAARQDESDEAPEFKEWSELVDWALVWHDGGIELEGIIPCCSWAVNHGYEPFSVALPEIPKAIARYAPAPRSTVSAAPDACGAFDWKRGELRVPAGADGRVVATIEEVAGDGDALLGVTFLPPGDALVVTRLVAPSEDPREDLARARTQVRDGDVDAAAVLLQSVVMAQPEPDVGTIGELGWALFRAGRLGEAERASEEALRRATNPRTRGAVLYNLGRIAEAQGDTARARERYQASLEARPNEVVQRRLASLGGGT